MTAIRKTAKKTTPPVAKKTAKKTAVKVTLKSATKTAIKTPIKTKAKPTAKPANKSALSVGDKAPAFSMPSLDGDISLAKHKGKNVVLYFYPKDDTSGCTAEACSFQDYLPKFKKTNAVIIGVSKDNIASHTKFAKKYKLAFNLASDEDTKVAATYGVWVEKSMYGRKYMGMDRSTFLIDGKGVIRAIWNNVKVPGHVEEVMKAVKNLA